MNIWDNEDWLRKLWQEAVSTCLNMLNMHSEGSILEPFKLTVIGMNSKKQTCDYRSNRESCSFVPVSVA